jgi:hypothetical protein
VSDLTAVRGFEDLWRPTATPRRRERPFVPTGGGGGDVKARLARVVRRTPEVMVKITGKTKDGGHLQAHLSYISRKGSLTLEGGEGERYQGLKEIGEVGGDWTNEDVRRREDSSLSVSVMLSMPAGTDPLKLQGAVRQFGKEVFGGSFDYVFALHTDVDHPHVHMSVRSLGEGGKRLNPRKGDLDSWRQTFARALRDRGVEAEATPRRARGIVRKPEKMPIRKLRERSYEKRRGGGSGRPSDAPRVLDAAHQEAEAIAGGKISVERPWEPQITERQRSIRATYLEAAKVLARSDSAADRKLAEEVVAFVGSMPTPATRRNDLVRAAQGRAPAPFVTRDRGPGLER